MRLSANGEEPLQSQSAPPRQEVYEFPCSPAQQRLWFVDRIQSASTAYNMSVAARLAGHLEVAVLKRCLTEIARRHESLRTTFRESGGEPCQVISTAVPAGILLEDLGSLPELDRELEVQRILAGEAGTRFDLERGPLWQVRLISLDPRSHVLVLTMHHIISDGWSLGILFRELSELYRAFLTGGDSPLDEMEIQYADFAMWHRDWARSSEFGRQLAYWKERLAGAPERLELFSDHPRPPAPSWRGSLERFVIPALELTEFSTLCMRRGCTPFMGLLSLFLVLLFRHTGETDLVVGTPVSGRVRPEVHPVIGFFLNMLALRTQVAGDLTFTELLASVRETCLEAFQHQEAPFEAVVAAVQTERRLSQSPLFQVAFVVNEPPDAFRLPGITATRLDADNGTSKYDLSLYLTLEGGKADGLLEYSLDLFEAETIRRLAGHYLRLLGAVLANPEERICQLAMLTGEEEQQIRQWNATAAPAPQALLQSGFLEQARLHPDRVAVIDARKQLSYGQVARAVRNIADELRSLGARPDTLVAIVMEKGWEQVPAAIGILESGSAYLPLDPTWPAERLRRLLEIGEVRLALTQPWIAGRVEWPTEVHRLEIGEDYLERVPAAAGACSSIPAGLAYVIFTSGSTGEPKGVMIEHRAALNTVLDINERFGVGAGDRVLSLSALSFDLSVYDIFGVLAAGGAVVLPDGESKLAPDLWLDLMARHRVTIWNSTPLPLQLALDHSQGGALPASLRLAMLSGDYIPLPMPAHFERSAPRARFVSLGGATEASIWSICYPVERTDPHWKTIPYGRPLGNQRFYVLNEAFRNCPIGAAGSLAIAGDGLARGYWRDEEKTRRSFPSHPGTGERLYLTGDRGRYLPGGIIEFLGRSDEQLKIRGFRVEPGEIEATFQQHPGILNAVVVKQRSDSGQTSLAACVVPDLDSPEWSAGAPTAVLEAERVRQWASVYDSAALPSANETAGSELPLAGWNSSLSGQPFPVEEMREMVECTSNRILSLRPQRVLEIGCGAGLLLRRIAPQCKRYVGTDQASVALRSLAAGLPPLLKARVELLEQAADADSLIPAEAFDTVVLNSVVQYFPSEEYLTKVLQIAVHTLAEGGRIFVGDVRDLRLLEVFHTLVQCRTAGDAMPLAHLRQRIRRAIFDEPELAIDAAYFSGLQRLLPRVSGARVLLKRGRLDNELTRFRYDVVISLDGAGGPAAFSEAGHWEPAPAAPDELFAWLRNTAPAAARVAGVSNGRLAEALAFHRALAQSGSGLSTVADLRQAVSGPPPGLHPEEFWSLAERLPYRVEVAPNAAEPGRFDVLLIGVGHQEPTAPKPSATTPRAPYTNDPLRRERAAALAVRLRTFLKGRLPEYMVPSRILVVPDLPLTANGKVDRRQLLIPEARPGVPPVESESPRSPVEQLLCGIWEEVLRLPTVGVHQNFFELGGDSIQSIQIVTRANQAGLRLTPRQIFEQQTIAELAAVAGTMADAQAGAVQPGAVPLSPVQRWFLEMELPEPHYWNQSVLLVPQRPLGVDLIRSAVTEVFAHHPALRLRFCRDGTGWRQEYAAKESADIWALIDLSNVPESDRPARLAAETGAIQASLELEHGPIARAAYFHLGPGVAGRLLLTAHHLAVDGISWRILLEDLQTACEQLTRGQPIRLPTGITSYRQWTEALSMHVSSPSLQEEAAFWERMSLPAARLPLDWNQGSNTEASSGTVEAELSAAQTRALFEAAAACYRCGVDDILFSALASALAPMMSSGELIVDVERHGREAVTDGLDLSRTVGWFTSIFPVRLDPPSQPVVRRLQGIPNGGLGYGLLRYLHPDAAMRERFACGQQAEISFNYLGRFDQSGESWFAPAAEPCAASMSPASPRRYVFDVGVLVVDGKLRLSWTYSRNLHRRSTVERLADRFLSAVRRMLPAEATGADAVENSYPLSPTQEGILFHALQEPESSAYFQQVACRIVGPLQVGALERAWLELIRRNAVLRTEFKGVPEPVQVVRREVPLPLVMLDWSGLSESDRQERLEMYLAADRGRGFTLDRAPLFRLALICLAAGTYQFVWSHHHLLLDGWSWSLLQQETFALYRAFSSGSALPPARRGSYRSFIDHLLKQDLAAPERFWREALKGFRTPTPLPVERTAQAGGPATFVEQRTRLSLTETASLQQFARTRHLTLSTLVHAAWALLLSRCSGRDDVVFGSVISGRPPELPEVESMVGLFVNTVPVRARIPEALPLESWLVQFQARQAAALPFSHCPLVRVRSWSDCPAGAPLLETLVVFQNYPVSSPLDDGLEELRFEDVRTFDPTSYPLSLDVAPGPELTLQLTWDRRRMDSLAAGQILDHLSCLLCAFPECGGVEIGRIRMASADQRSSAVSVFNENVEAE